MNSIVRETILCLATFLVAYVGARVRLAYSKRTREQQEAPRREASLFRPRDLRGVIIVLFFLWSMMGTLIWVFLPILVPLDISQMLFGGPPGQPAGGADALIMVAVMVVVVITWSALLRFAQRRYRLISRLAPDWEHLAPFQVGILLALLPSRIDGDAHPADSRPLRACQIRLSDLSMREEPFQFGESEPEP